MVKSWIFLSFILIPFFGTTQDKSQADHYYDEGSYVQAFSAYSEIVKTDSSSVYNVQRAGSCAINLGMYKEAKSLFHHLEKIDTSNLNAFKSLAKIYEFEGQVPKTIKYYLKLSKLFPDNPIYLRKLAIHYLKGGEPTGAFSYYREAYKRNPKDVFTIIGMTDMLLSNKQFVEADSVLRLALDYDSTNVKFNLSYAGSKYRQRQYDTVTTVLKKVSHRVDLTNYYNKMLGYSYMQIDSLDRAIVHLEKSLVDEKAPEKAHYYLASAYEKKEETSTALFHFEKAISSGISDEIALYHRLMARIYNKENKLKEALKHYEEAYLFSKDPEMLFFMARAADIYYKDKNIAIRYYTRYHKSDHKNEEYKKYALERKQYLRQQAHFEK